MTQRQDEIGWGGPRRWALGGVLAIATGCADPGTPLAPDDDDPAATDSEQEPPETSATTGGAIDSSDDAAESTTAEPVDCDFDDVGIVVPTPDGCCGCTCGETRWSCSADTCLTPDGTAEALAPEAGFFELAPYEYSWNGAAKTSARSRVWYSFWPADDQPQQRPLMILFNGGPGSSTGLLFGSNTAPFTLDPQRTDSVAATERPWTEGFNLLFVDAPGTGFSYDLAQPDGTTQSVGIDPDRDASAFISVLLRFLARHPALQSNQIVILGESYGGTRAMLMLEQMLDYETLIDGTNPYQNPSVYAEIRRHLASLEPDGCGDGWSRDEIASQLRFVSVQGLVAGYGQVFGPASTSSSCIPGGDVYHCDRPDGWLWGIAAQIADRLRQPAVLDTVLGVDPSTIAWMHADARTGAYGRTVIADESAMVSIFGELSSGDAYYMDFNSEVTMGARDARPWWDDVMADVFLRAVATTPTLLTDGRLDNAVPIEALPPTLANRKPAVSSVVHDLEPRPGVDRPGWVQVEYVPGWAPGGVRQRELRAPRYAQAGHTVTLDEPELLLDDVMAWLDGR